MVLCHSDWFRVVASTQNIVGNMDVSMVFRRGTFLVDVLKECRIGVLTK